MKTGLVREGDPKKPDKGKLAMTKPHTKELVSWKEQVRLGVVVHACNATWEAEARGLLKI